MADSLVIIPTYNEKENIQKIIEAIFALPQAFHVLIIDDGSPDGTAQIVQNLQTTRYPNSLFLVQRTGKQGLGTAYICGFKWALEPKNSAYTFIFEMDADFSHAPPDLLRLREACINKNADVAVGSRYVKGGSVKNWPLDRVLLSKYASVYARLVTFMPIHDTTAGFVCYTRRALNTLDLNKIRFVGYAFQIEMKYAMWQLGFKVAEVPIVFTDRQEGNSKMSGNIIKEAVMGVLKMRFNSFFNDYKKTVTFDN